jgi:hypothetical protein
VKAGKKEESHTEARRHGGERGGEGVSVATNLAVANRGDVRYQIILIAINVVSLLFFLFS